MKKESLTQSALDHHIGCFGEFNRSDRVCTACCALRLRCAIEREQSIRMEIIDELVSADQMVVKIQ